MHLIAYMSHYAGAVPQISKALRDIEAVAKARNGELGVTGVLFYFDGRFLQFIEGDEAVLRRLLARIAADRRHVNIEYLIDQPVESPSFGEWNMDVFDLGGLNNASEEVVKGVIEAYQANFKMKTDRLVSVIKGFLLKQRPRVVSGEGGS